MKSKLLHKHSIRLLAPLIMLGLPYTVGAQTLPTGLVTPTLPSSPAIGVPNLPATPAIPNAGLPAPFTPGSLPSADAAIALINNTDPASLPNAGNNAIGIASGFSPALRVLDTQGPAAVPVSLLSGTTLLSSTLLPDLIPKAPVLNQPVNVLGNATPLPATPTLPDLPM